MHRYEMRRFLLIFAAAGAFACSSGDDGDDTVVDPMDAGVSFDATVIRDAGPRDAGPRVRPDAGFGDPATILMGEERINGQRIYMHIRGTTTSTMPPILFLSTGPMIGMEYLPEPFDFMLGNGGAEDPDRMLVFADLRAVGRSSFGSTDTATVSFETHLLDVQTIMDHARSVTGVTGPFDIVGHGYGAGVAVNFQVLNPTEVNRLVLIGPFPTDLSQYSDLAGEVENRLTTPDRVRIMQLSMWQNCLRDLNRCSIEIWRVRGPHYLCPQNLDLFETMEFLYGDFRALEFYVIPQLRIEMYDWTPILPQVSAPTTVFYGQCDPTPPETYDDYINLIPGAQGHIFDNSGHFPFVEEPARFQWLLRQALTYP